MAKIDKIVASKPHTFENTVQAYAKMEYEYSAAASHLLFLKNVSPSSDVRTAIQKATKLFSDNDLAIENRVDFYHAFKDYKESSIQSGEWDKLAAEDQRYVTRVMQEYELNGLDLPKEQKEKLTVIKAEINELERMAEENIGEDKTKVEVLESKLLGLDSSFISKLEKVEGKEGYRYVTLKMPDISPSLKLVQDEDTRKKLFFAYQNLASQNTPLIEQLVQKRHEMALILGFSSYSEYTLQRKMARNPETVQKFEEDLT
jgi:Zn-dependent oligopeptidase